MIDLLLRNVPSAMLALEEGREWHMQRALAWLAGDPKYLAGEWCQANPEEAREVLAEHADTLNKLGRRYNCIGNMALRDVAGWVETHCKGGARVLFIDPISLADPGGEKPWEADRAFMARVKVSLEEYGASLVLVSHPRKASSGAKGGPVMDDLAGGAAFTRAAACALWLTNQPEGKSELLRTSSGHEYFGEIHKIMTIMKTRDATGSGSSIGFRFERLQFQESGKIVTDAQKKEPMPKKQTRPPVPTADRERSAEDLGKWMADQPKEKP
jgi:hypothetical protein